MEKLIVNPKNYREEYIKNLNECFGNWGGEMEYNWVFKRKIGAHSSDILLIQNEEDGVIAGSAISYRRLGNQDQAFDIGIMTGSWTLPAARRKGCFTKMINASKDLCNKKNVDYLTAFVTETNASCRRLESAGSLMVPSYHLFSPEEPFKEIKQEAKVVEANDETCNQVFETMKERQTGLLNFQYNLDEFHGQYINRIKDTIILKTKKDFAILEEGANEVKVLQLTYQDVEAFEENMKAVTNWCLKNKKQKAFYYTTRQILKERCEALGFENLSGFFTVLNTESEEVDPEVFKNININMADKM